MKNLSRRKLQLISRAVHSIDRCAELAHNTWMIRKQILKDAQAVESARLDLESLASFEISSEDPKHPIENALRENQKGWQAAADGEQTIRMAFDSPQTISRIALLFEENDASRTQEFSLSWRSSTDSNWREIVRQQFNFSPPGTTSEREVFNIPLNDVIGVELKIVPDIGGKGRASLKELVIS